MFHLYEPCDHWDHQQQTISGVTHLTTGHSGLRRLAADGKAVLRKSCGAT